MSNFNIFWITNKDNNVMKIPYKHCTFFLGLLQGPLVDNWVHNQAIILREKVTWASNPIERTNNTLWKDLSNTFKNTFAHTSRVKMAKKELACHKMEGEDIDTYITKFENLLCKAKILQ